MRRMQALLLNCIILSYPSKIKFHFCNLHKIRLSIHIRRLRIWYVCKDCIDFCGFSATKMHWLHAVLLIIENNFTIIHQLHMAFRIKKGRLSLSSFKREKRRWMTVVCGFETDSRYNGVFYPSGSIVAAFSRNYAGCCRRFFRQSNIYAAACGQDGKTLYAV